MESAGSLICLLGAMLFVVFIVLVQSIRLVPEDKRLSVYRFGQYIGDKEPGIVILLPIVDRGILRNIDDPQDPAAQ